MKGLDEGFLDEIFRFFPVFDHLIDHIEDAVLIPMQESFVGRFISMEGFLDDAVDILLRHDTPSWFFGRSINLRKVN